MDTTENIKTARARFPGDEKRNCHYRHMSTLNRRIEHLEKQLENKQCSPNSENYLRAELAALRWAIKTITEKQDTPPVA